MGNVLAECQKCSIHQCELCTDVVSARQGGVTNTGQGPPGGATGQTGDVANEVQRGPGGHHEYQPADMSEADMIQQALRMSRLEAEGGRRAVGEGATQNAGGAGSSGSNRQGPLIGEDDPTLMAAMAASYAASPPRGSQQQTDEEIAAAAIRKSRQEADNRERQRLRDEQAAEYEESLAADRAKEAQKAIKAKEEEERKNKEAAEEAAKRREEEQRLAEEAAAEDAKRSKVATLLEEAREKLMPEPEKDEPNRVQVLVRSPEGKRMQRAFRADDPIDQLYYFANTQGGDDLVAQDYRLVSAMPRVLYDDREATLADAGLQGQCALLVEVVDE